MGKTKHLLLACFLALAMNCGGGSDSTPATDSDYGALLQDVDQVGGLMASKAGEVFMPMVVRDSYGDATGITGAQWTGTDGGTVTLYLNSTTGLPTKIVNGDYVYVFDTWDTAALTVNVAVIYSPTNFIQIFKGVDLNHSDIATHLEELQSLTANLSLPSKSFGVEKSFCFPACGSDTANLAGLIKVAGLSFSVAACGLGVAATGGALAPALVVPCGSLIISTATLLVGDEAWLNSLETTSTVLSFHSVLTCTTNPVECVAGVLETGSNMVLGSDTSLEDDATNITTATGFFATKPSEYSTGTTPSGCAAESSYQCTAGSYLPCYTGGSKQCGSDCTWGECPSSGDVATLDGSYAGSYSGSCTCSDGTEPEFGTVALTISDGALTVTAPIPGSGTVAALGGSTFGGGGGGGITYSFSGSFVLVGSSGAVGSGSWSGTATDTVCSGVWSVKR